VSFEKNTVQNDIRVNPRKEMNQFIPPPQGFILYSGIALIALFLVIALAISHLISYPDVIQSQGEIKTVIPTLELYSSSSASIKHLFCKEGDTLFKRDRILILDNDADFRDLDSAYQSLQVFRKIKTIDDYTGIKLNENFNLGQLQDAYNSIILNLADLQFDLKDKITNQRINVIHQDINLLDKMESAQRKNMQNYDKEIALSDKENYRKRTLEQEGFVSLSEMEADSMKVLQHLRSRVNMKTDLLRSESQKLNLQKQKLELSQQRRIQLFTKEKALKNAIVQFLTMLKNWRKSYEFVAERDGIIVFKENLLEGVFLQSGQHFSSMIPIVKPNPIICDLEISSTDYGKIKIGQYAILQCAAYPREEFGSLRATVQQIEAIPYKSKEEEAKYKVRLWIGEELVTDQNIALPISQNLQASVEIITKEKSILQRIFEKFVSLIKKRL
jgi:multidrug efflux pump subunit AcrA (membrane-fusion protein)